MAESESSLSDWELTRRAFAGALTTHDYEARRAELRKLAMPIMEFHLDGAGIERLYAESPLVGDSPTQVSPRPTISGLRDMLDEETLVDLINTNVIGHSVTEVFRRMWLAIKEPEVHGVKSLRSKTGFAFGRHKSVNPDILVAARAAFVPSTPTTTEGESPMPESNSLADVSLDDLCLIVGACMSRLGGLASIEQIIETGKKITGVERFDAVASLASTGAELPVRDIEPSDGPCYHAIEAICKALTEDEASEDSKPVEPVKAKYEIPPAKQSALIDLTLSQAGLPSIDTLLKELDEATRRVVEAEARSTSLAIPAVEVEANSDGTIPRGTVKIIKAYEAFNITRAGRDAFDFDVPVWNWDSAHPHVPAVDADYIFRPFDLLRCLYAIVTSQRAYLHGHTGSGKSTLVEQIAARLYWPYMRVNFDSEITRMDLIGRDVLINEGGVTTSKFADGILPQMMAGPYIGCFDEMDFVRPDVAYVMQRALEGGGLMLTEDGGRIVKPHRMFRIFATGNTVGQGDEFGMYQGARPQSLAMLDRFTVWVKVEYLNSTERKKLLKARVASLNEEMLNGVNKYVTEHLEAFLSSKVLQPISPRGMIALSQSLVTFTAWMGESRKKEAIAQAFNTTILDRATAQDRVVLKGIVDRVFV